MASAQDEQHNGALSGGESASSVGEARREGTPNLDLNSASTATHPDEERQQMSAAEASPSPGKEDPGFALPDSPKEGAIGGVPANQLPAHRPGDIVQNKGNAGAASALGERGEPPGSSQRLRRPDDRGADGGGGGAAAAAAAVGKDAFDSAATEPTQTYPSNAASGSSADAKVDTEGQSQVAHARLSTLTYEGRVSFEAPPSSANPQAIRSSVTDGVLEVTRQLDLERDIQRKLKSMLEERLREFHIRIHLSADVVLRMEERPAISDARQERLEILLLRHENLITQHEERHQEEMRRMRSDHGATTAKSRRQLQQVEDALQKKTEEGEKMAKELEKVKAENERLKDRLAMTDADLELLEEDQRSDMGGDDGSELLIAKQEMSSAVQDTQPPGSAHEMLVRGTSHLRPKICDPVEERLHSERVRTFREAIVRRVGDTESLFSGQDSTRHACQQCMVIGSLVKACCREASPSGPAAAASSASGGAASRSACVGAATSHNSDQACPGASTNDATSLGSQCGKPVLAYLAVVHPSAEHTDIGKTLRLTGEDLTSPANYLCLHVQLARYIALGQAALVPGWDPDDRVICQPLRLHFYVWDKKLLDRTVAVMLNPNCPEVLGVPIMDGDNPLTLRQLHGRVVNIPEQELPRMDLLGINLWFMLWHAMENGMELPALGSKSGTDFKPVDNEMKEDMRRLCLALFADVSAEVKRAFIIAMDVHNAVSAIHSTPQEEREICQTA